MIKSLCFPVYPLGSRYQTYESVGRRFESCRAHHKKIVVGVNDTIHSLFSLWFTQEVFNIWDTNGEGRVEPLKGALS